MKKYLFLTTILFSLLSLVSCKDKSQALSKNASKWNSLMQHVNTVGSVEKQINDLGGYAMLKSRASEAKNYIKNSEDDINNIPKDEDEKAMYNALLDCMKIYDSILDIYLDFATKSEAGTLTENDVEVGYAKIETLYEQFDVKSDLFKDALRKYAKSNGITNYRI